MSDLINIGQDVQSFQKSTKFKPYDRVVLNLDDNNYISSPSVSVTNASVYSSYANGIYKFIYTPDQSKWKTPTDTYVTTSELAQTYGLTTYYSNVTSPKNGDEITVNKITVNGTVTVTAELSRSGSTLTADCPLVKPSDRQSVADNLLAQVYGFEYQPFSAKGAYMNPAAEIGDAITAYNVFSGIFEQETIFNRLMLSNIGSALTDEAVAEMQYETNADRRYNRKAAQTAAEFAILADEISARVTSQELEAELAIVAQAISAKVSSTGGTPSSFSWSLDANGFYLYANGSQVFKCDSTGITVTGNGTFTGNVYAANIKNDAVDGYGGYYSGSGITPSSIATAQCSSGVVTSLGYADMFHAASQTGTSTYYDEFTAKKINAIVAFYSGSYKVQEQGSVVYDMTAHYHSFTEQNGKIYMSSPTGDSTHANFDIAATQTYIDGVAAATVDSRTVLSTDASTVNTYSTNFNCTFTASQLYNPSGTSYQYGRIDIKNAAGNILKTIRIQIPVSSSSVTFDSATGLTTSSSNYTTYDYPVSFASSSLYTSGSTTYARIQVGLSNGSSAIIRAAIPDASGSVNVSSASGLASDSSNYTTYDKAVSFASSSLYTSGSTQYARILVNLSNGQSAILRAAIPASGGSTVDNITAALTAVTGSATTPSNYPYGLEWDGSNHYIWMNLYAKSGNTTVYTQSNYRLQVSNIIDTAYQLGYQQGYAAGGGGGPSNSVRMRCNAREADEPGYYVYRFYCVLQGSNRFSVNSEYTFYYY